MSNNVLSVAVPWSLSHYISLNGFHPLYQALFESRPDWVVPYAWDNTRLSQQLRNDNIFQQQIQRDVREENERQRTQKASRIERGYNGHYWTANRVLTERLPGEIEFHHTAPFPGLQRPFVFHCESFSPVFYPFSHQGTGRLHSQAQIREHYRRIFETPLCLGIYSHLPETLADFKRFFSSPIIDQKLGLSRIGLHSPTQGRQPETGKAPLEATRFLFINSAHQNPANFFLRGGHLALRFWQGFSSYHDQARLYLRCQRPSDALLREYGIDLAWLRQQEQNSVVWIEDYLTRHELDELMEAAHFLLLPSASLHSVSIMQAMAHEAIPVVSDTIGTNRYVSDDKDGIILSGVLHNNWRLDPKSGVMVDHYKRNPELEQSLVNQLLERIGNLLQHPERYQAMRTALRDKVQDEFSGRQFADDFWQKVRTSYSQLLSTGWQPLLPSTDDQSPCASMIKEKDWPRIFASVPQPVPRLQAGPGRVLELGGAFVYMPDCRSMELHDWSPVAEYIDPKAPPLIWAPSIKQLDGCFLPKPGNNYHISIARHTVKSVAGWLMPYPRFYAVASRIYRWMRLTRRTLIRRRYTSEGSGVPPVVGTQLIRYNVQGMNVICNERNIFYAIPMSEGEFSQKRADNGKYSLCIKGNSLEAVLQQLERLPIQLDAIHHIELIEENIGGFNLIKCSNRFFAIRAKDGAFNLQRALNNGYPKMISGYSEMEVKTALEKKKSWL
jgi:hypothetical protein